MFDLIYSYGLSYYRSASKLIKYLRNSNGGDYKKSGSIYSNTLSTIFDKFLSRLILYYILELFNKARPRDVLFSIIYCIN